jgi:hypothetical protein
MCRRGYSPAEHLNAPEALLAAVAVVPREDERDRQPDGEPEQGDLRHLLGPVEGLADVLEALEEPPRCLPVRSSPSRCSMSKA